MKELIEKIKKEIKKKIESYMDLQCDFEDHEMSYQEEILDNHYEGCKSGLETAIDIINKEAKSYNNGWIPCSERLPEDGETVLVQDFEEHYEILNCETKYGVKGFSNGWWASANNYIAWQPLPEPYQPKGE